MVSFSCLTLNNEDYGRNIQTELRKTVWFLHERKPLHITFIWFGKEYGHQEMYDDFTKSVLELSEKDRTIQADTYEEWDTRKGPILVCKFKCSDQLKNLQKQLRAKYRIKDHIDNYTPHITMGKFRNKTNYSRPAQKDSLVITGVIFK